MVNASWLTMMGPTYAWGTCMYAHVIVAYIFTIIILGLLWKNYREVVQLKREYFNSPEYLDSLHSRTLMVGGSFRRNGSGC